MGKRLVIFYSPFVEKDRPGILYCDVYAKALSHGQVLVVQSVMGFIKDILTHGLCSVVGGHNLCHNVLSQNTQLFFLGSFTLQRQLWL